MAQNYCNHVTSNYNINNVSVDMLTMISTLVNVVTNKKLNFVKIIGEGGFGKILLYQDNLTNEKVVLKQTKSIQEWVNLTELRKVDCKQIDAIPLMAMTTKKITWYFILMPFRDGSLDKIINTNPNMQLKHVLELFTYITSQIVCLHKHGFYYTDIKLDNILFQCNGKTYTVMFGDLGSIVKKNQNGATTFPPWIYFRNKQPIIGSDQSVVWGLCVLLLHFFVNKQVINQYFSWNAGVNVDKYYVINQIQNKQIVTLLKDAMITSSHHKGLTVNQFYDRLILINKNIK